MKRSTAAKLGITAQLLFVASWLVFGFFQGSTYSWRAHSISDMYAQTAQHGLILALILTVCGLATIIFVLFALLPNIRQYSKSKLAKAGAILLTLSVFGLGNLLAPFERLACRIADQGCTSSQQVSTLGGRLDSNLTFFGILFLILALFFIGYGLHKAAGGWTLYTRYVRAGGFALVALLLVEGFVTESFSGVTRTSSRSSWRSGDCSDRFRCAESRIGCEKRCNHVKYLCYTAVAL